MRIGICGTGKMGAAIASRLLQQGRTVAVWNRDGAKTTPLAAAGAEVAATPASLAAACDLVISMLLNAEAIDAVYRGTGGILSADLSGRLVIDMSTVLPEVEQALAADVAAKGGAFLDCPVGGTVAPAREGKLFGLVGGADVDVARALPVLRALCRRVEHVGPVGAGSTVKLAINLPLLVYWQALGEALSLCRPLDLPPARLLDIMADSSGATTGLKGRAPDIVRGLEGAPAGPGSFDVTAARKDLATMLAEARRLGRRMVVTEAALSAYDAAIAAGLGSADAGRVAVHVAKGT